MDNVSQISSSSEDSLYPSYVIDYQGEISQQFSKTLPVIGFQQVRPPNLPILPNQVGNYLRVGQLIKLKAPQQGVYASESFKNEQYDCIRRVISDVSFSGIPQRIFGLDKYQKDFQEKALKARRMGKLNSLIFGLSYRSNSVRFTQNEANKKNTTMQEFLKGKLTVPVPNLPRLQKITRRRHKSVQSPQRTHFANKFIRKTRVKRRKANKL